MRYCIHNIYQSLTRKCQMLINILIMSPDTHSLTDLNLLITHSLNTGKDMTQVWQWITRLLCVWVCIKTCEVSVRLLMTAPVLQGRRGLMTSGNCDPRPWPLNLTCERQQDNIRRSKSDCWTERDQQQNDCQSDSRWTTADGSHSALNLSDGRNGCSHCCCFLKQLCVKLSLLSFFFFFLSCPNQNCVISACRMMNVKNFPFSSAEEEKFLCDHLKGSVCNFCH